MKSVYLIALAAAASGCTLALDTEPFRTADAAVSLADAGTSDATSTPDTGSPDASVLLKVQDILPVQLLEGLGSGHSTVRGTAVWMGGSGLFVDDVTSSDFEILSWRSAEDGSSLGIALRVPVDEALDQDQTALGEIQLVRDGQSSRHTVQITGLDERVISGALPNGFTPGVYSRLTLQGGQLGGRAALTLEATAEIIVQGNLRVEGLSDGRAGPGGCDGAPEDQDANCGARGGQSGRAQAMQLPSGGGGGGNLEAGAPGDSYASGPAPGAAGDAAVTQPLIEGLGTMRGAGGGGGGGSGSGHGGGGGGAVALITRGLLTVDGDLNAQGGPGAPLMEPNCALAGGGGGSGGILILRAWTMQGTGTLQVAGGASGGVPNCENRGGRGGDGVAYVQTSSTVADVIVEPSTSRRSGPSWAMDTPVIVGSTARFPIQGVPGQNYWLGVAEGPEDSGLLPASGRAEVELTGLQPGISKVCLRRESGVSNAPEVRNCLEFAIVD